MRVVFAPAAARDLDDIWLEIAQDSVKNADTLIERLCDRLQQLVTFPESGSLRREIATDARSLTEGSYLILYRIADAQVEIIRIIHGARDLTALL
ncbi:MAG: type II toxin-antitoxin system RelE/ParE family toxin [Rhizobiaceae bacterium]